MLIEQDYEKYMKDKYEFQTENNNKPQEEPETIFDKIYTNNSLILK
jgi:hypothetical protein